MKLAKHLYRHPMGAFYFVLAVPKALQPTLGRNRIKYSLETKDPNRAKAEAYRHTAHWLEQFERAKPMSNEEDRIYKAHLWLDSIYKKKEAKEEEKTGLELLLENASKFHVEATQMSDGSYYWVCLSSTDDEDKEEGKKLARELNLRNAKPITKTVEVVKQQPKEIDVFKPKKALTMQEAYSIWLEEIKETKNKKTKSIKDKAVFDLKQYIGPKELLYKIGFEELQKFKFYLLNEVKNEANTVHFKFNWIIQFFELMKKGKYYLGDNPAKGQAKLSSSDKDKLTDENRYLPFSEDEIEKIFSCSEYRKINKPHLFWCPLIALFTGMRASEIGQLYIEDISKTNLSIRVEKTKDDQSLKSKYSRRTLPIHQTLIDIGFLEYVDDMKKFGKRLFPNLTKTTNGYGTRISNDFTRYLEEIGIKEERKSLHSFRSLVNQKLGVKHINWKVQHRFIGHEIEGINYKHYDREVSFERLQDEALPYILFNLPDCIKYQSKQFDEYIQKILINKTK